MAFVVEDGTGTVATANAYASVAAVDAYWSDRGQASAWAALATPAKQAAIVDATDYIDLRWGSRLLGTPLLATQPLCFPRLWDWAPMPAALTRAVAEYAMRASRAPLLPDVQNQGVQSIREKVGPLETATVYRTQPAFVRYDSADGILLPYLSTALTSGRVIR